MIPFVVSGDTQGYLETRMKKAILDYPISQSNLSLNNNHDYLLQYPGPALFPRQTVTAVRISIVEANFILQIHPVKVTHRCQLLSSHVNTQALFHFHKTLYYRKA